MTRSRTGSQIEAAQTPVGAVDNQQRVGVGLAQRLWQVQCADRTRTVGETRLGATGEHIDGHGARLTRIERGRGSGHGHCALQRLVVWRLRLGVVMVTRAMTALMSGSDSRRRHGDLGSDETRIRQSCKCNMHAVRGRATQKGTSIPAADTMQRVQTRSERKDAAPKAQAKSAKNETAASAVAGDSLCRCTAVLRHCLCTFRHGVLSKLSG